MKIKKYGICLMLVLTFVITSFAVTPVQAKPKCKHVYKTCYEVNWGNSSAAKKHYKVTKCKKCGYRKSSKAQSHQFKGKKCKVCGYKK